MALVKRADGTFLINQSPLQFGLIRQARGLFNVPLQTALDIAAQLRAAGIEAYAASDMGSEQDPAYKPPVQQVDLSVVWPATWRIEVEQLSENRFCHKFQNAEGVQSSVIGATPQQVVDRLNARLDFDARQYVASITPEPIPEQVATPTAPALELPRKVLRPGDRSWSQQDMDELQAQRAEREKPKTPPIEIEYAYWYNTASGAAVKVRMQTEPAFYAWLQREGILDMRSNAYADARV